MDLDSDAPDRTLTIVRNFDAPRELVFKAWSQPEQVVRWWGPKGFTTPSYRMDVRQGGSYRTVMRSPEGREHVMRGRYREVVPPERLVMTFAWEDAEGRTGHETMVEVLFEDIAGRTRLTFRHGTFESSEACDQHLQGWTRFMESLADYLVDGRAVDA